MPRFFANFLAIFLRRADLAAERHRVAVHSRERRGESVLGAAEGRHLAVNHRVGDAWGETLAKSTTILQKAPLAYRAIANAANVCSNVREVWSDIFLNSSSVHHFRYSTRGY